MVVFDNRLYNVDVARMNRNTMRAGPGLETMANKPPRPPCWQDFVSNSLVAESVLTDISKIARSSNDSFSSDSHCNIKLSKPKKLRARIHRTRSQFAIEESDLPLETLTVTLAETKPGDIGLCRDSSTDERIFQEDNDRKCRTWLRNIEASKPLEDVSCYDYSEQDREAVSLEIPDDTLCYDESDVTMATENSKNIKVYTDISHDNAVTTSTGRQIKGDIKRTSTLDAGGWINNG